jgi:serine/threonine protein kinase
MIGEILDGKYRIDRQLGAGGMGNVYLATHLGTTRVVAVKVIAPKWAADPHFLARFQREAQACGRLRHPNIVNVTDFGIASNGRRQIPYLVMELLDGETLSAFQQAHPRPALPLIADLLDQAGLALDEAHRNGIVHRDLKPDNIWLEPDGRGGYTVKVLDFGVAKMKLPGDPPAPSAPAPSAGTRTGGTAPAALDLPAAEMETIAMAPGLHSPPGRGCRNRRHAAGGPRSVLRVLRKRRRPHHAGQPRRHAGLYVAGTGARRGSRLSL